MKKLVLVLALLAITSVASAGLSLTVGGAVPTGAITLAPSDTISLGISGDGLSNNGTYFVGVMLDGPASFSNIALLTAANIDYTGNSTSIGAGTDGDYAAAFGTNVPYVEINMNDIIGSGNPVALLGTLVHGILLHCDGVGDVTVKIFNGDAGVESSLLIHQVSVPEPMTLGLLGLGGLFLRRRLA